MGMPHHLDSPLPGSSPTSSSNLQPTTANSTPTPICPIIMSHTHDDGSHAHAHDRSFGFNAAEHGHSHEILDGPGSYLGREMPIVEGRDWSERAFTVGIGG